MKCPHCDSDEINCNIGMCFIAYECKKCKYQWVEKFAEEEEKYVVEKEGI